jgi:hypothetical protein
VLRQQQAISARLSINGFVVHLRQKLRVLIRLLFQLLNKTRCAMFLASYRWDVHHCRGVGSFLRILELVETGPVFVTAYGTKSVVRALLFLRFISLHCTVVRKSLQRVLRCQRKRAKPARVICCSVPSSTAGVTVSSQSWHFATSYASYYL